MSAIAKFSSIILLGLGCATATCAADQPSNLAACRNITDATARLDCYDRATTAPPALPAAAPASKALSSATPAPALAPAPALSPTPPVAAAVPAAPAAPADSQQRFGLPEHKVVQQEVAAGTRDKDVNKIQAHILRVQPAPDQRMVFTLDNSQVWRQLNPEGDLLAKAGDTVTISRGLLGSYWLQAPSGRGSKVSRLN